MARGGVAEGADALFISCTNLPTYDVIPQLEAELRIPVLSANQVTAWAALHSIGIAAVGPYQALLDPAARAVLPGTVGPAVPSPGPLTGEPPELLRREGEGFDTPMV
jgi:maleate isomerase